MKIDDSLIFPFPGTVEDKIEYAKRFMPNHPILQGIEQKWKYSEGDIVRFKHDTHIFGLHEVTGEDANGEITVTSNECNSEFYANEKDLILVCSRENRKDI